MRYPKISKMHFPKNRPPHYFALDNGGLANTRKAADSDKQSDPLSTNKDETGNLVTWANCAHKSAVQHWQLHFSSLFMVTRQPRHQHELLDWLAATLLLASRHTAVNSIQPRIDRLRLVVLAQLRSQTAMNSNGLPWRAINGNAFIQCYCILSIIQYHSNSFSIFNHHSSFINGPFQTCRHPLHGFILGHPAARRCFACFASLPRSPLRTAARQGLKRTFAALEVTILYNWTCSKQTKMDENSQRVSYLPTILGSPCTAWT